MNVWSNGNDRITYDDATKKYQFLTDGEVRLEIAVDGNNGVIALKRHGTIQSNGDLLIHLDENQFTAPTAAKLKVFSGSDNEVFSVNEQGEVQIQQGTITTSKVQLGDQTGIDYILNVGIALPGYGRGRVTIWNQPEVIGDLGQPRKAGILVLHDEGGWENFLWVDANGKLRISRSDPGADDLSGAIVGTQS